MVTRESQLIEKHFALTKEEAQNSEKNDINKQTTSLQIETQKIY
jgi:hypothetical protein